MRSDVGDDRGGRAVRCLGDTLAGRIDHHADAGRRAAHQRAPALDRPQQHGSSVLSGGRPASEPTVVGDVHQEGRATLDLTADQIGVERLRTDRDREALPADLG